MNKPSVRRIILIISMFGVSACADGDEKRKSASKEYGIEQRSSPYNQNSVRSAHIACPSVRLETFSAPANGFARARGLRYRERRDNVDGSAFVIVMDNDRSQIWLAPDSSDAILSQYMARAVNDSQADWQLFSDAVRLFSRCGS